MPQKSVGTTTSFFLSFVSRTSRSRTKKLNTFSKCTKSLIHEKSRLHIQTTNLRLCLFERMSFVTTIPLYSISVKNSSFKIEFTLACFFQISLTEERLNLYELFHNPTAFGLD